MDTIDFNKNLNISYVDENLPKPSASLALKHYRYSLILYTCIYYILCYNPFFKIYFVDDLNFLYRIIFCIYVVVAPLIYLIFRPRSLYASHSIEIFNYFSKVIKRIFTKNKNNDYQTILNIFIPTYKEKQSLMLMFIKVFFGTLMVNFTYNDVFEIQKSIGEISQIISQVSWETIILNAEALYRFAILIFFTIDVLVFAIGYLSECVFLGNKIKTVETNIFGVLICLACYPPFHNASGEFIGWHQNDLAVAFNDPTSAITWSFRLVALFFLFIYTAASCALGTKASNLTNRGTVSTFPYNIVRHPAYISKNLFWLLTTIPLLLVDFRAENFNLGNHLSFSILVLLSTITWMSIYYFRAITEERHLMQDPEYQEYTKKVKYRFIPYII